MQTINGTIQLTNQQPQRIPNDGYFRGENNFRALERYRNDPNYWIVGIEDGWIEPTKELLEWYYNQKSNKD